MKLVLCICASALVTSIFPPRATNGWNLIRQTSSETLPLRPLFGNIGVILPMPGPPSNPSIKPRTKMPGNCLVVPVALHPKCPHPINLGDLRFRFVDEVGPEVWRSTQVMGWGQWLVLVGWWFQPPLKNISQNGNLPQVGVKKKYLKPPPSYCCWFTSLGDQVVMEPTIPANQLRF